MRIWLLALLMSAVAVAQEPLRLVQWSDIHSGGEHYSAGSLEEARRESLAFKPHAILITGDNGDNGESPETFYDRLGAFLRKLAYGLRDVRVPLVLCLGNNDFQANYQSDPPLLETTQRLFRQTFGKRYYLDRLGNGVLPQKPGGQTWITLNTQIFSRKNRYAKVEEQSTQTLDWLQEQLRGGPVVLVMHVPPTVDLWDGKQAWRPDPLRRFAGILQAYPDSVTIVAGHYHRNQVQYFQRPQGDVPILIAGSLSTKYGYETNWRTWEWTPGRYEYTLYYPGHPDWTRRYRVEGAESFLRQLDWPGFVADLFAHHKDEAARVADPGLKAQYLRDFYVSP